MDDKIPDREENPYNAAGPISRLLYLWVTPLVWRGYSKDSVEISNYKPRKLDAAEKNHSVLEREWKSELSNKKRPPRLEKAIIRGFGKTLVFCSLSYFTRFTILGVLQTYFLDVLIGTFDADRNEWLGPREVRRYIAAGVIIVSTYLAPMLIHHAFFNAQVQGVRLAVACSSLVYQKVLKTSKAVLNSVDVGMLFNLLSNDVGKFDLAMNSAYTSIMEPISIVVNILFLYWMIGPAAFPGFGVMAFVIIVYMIQAKFFKTVSKKRTLATDERLKYTSTVISEMKAIKMFSWDSPYKSLIKDMRNKESKYLRYTCFLRASNFTITAIADKIALFFTILCGVLLNARIDSHFIYPAWMTFSRVKDTFIGQITQAFEEIVGCVIAVKRIQAILMLDEMNGSVSALNNLNDRTKPEAVHINLNNLSTSWSSNGSVFQLKKISLIVPRASICFIAGPVGSGKSSLLMSILNEMYVLEGTFSRSDRIGYASQEPWIFPATIRQNILFGMPYDEVRYSAVINASALTLDMTLFENGDETSVGDKGSTLSGGQKARINLARAMYRNADILLLDDPISAVDVNVGKHIMKNCVKDLANDTLRVLVCHQLHYLEDENYLVYMSEGKTEVQGRYEDIKNDVQDILSKAGDHFDLDTMVTKSDNVEISTTITQVGNGNDVVKPMAGKAIKMKIKKNVTNAEPSKPKKTRSPHLVYLKIFLKLGTLFVVLFLLLIGQVMVTSSDIWLQRWSAASGALHPLISLANDSITLSENKTLFVNSTNKDYDHFHIDIFGQHIDSPNMALIILSSLALLQLSFIYFGYLVFFLSSLKASEFLFQRMLDGVFSAKMKFFATNPKGRLINRFANDMESVDDLLPINLGNAIVRILNICGTIAVIIYCNYIIAIPLIVVLIGEVFICKIYFKNMKPMKRIEASARSPVYTYLSTSMQGIATIRAHKNEDVVVREFNGHQDFHTSTSVLGVFFIRWFGFWQDCLIACLTTFTTILLLFVPGVGVGSKIGLSISSIFTATYKLQFGLRQLCEADNKVISVERIEEYGSLPPEDGYYLKMPETVSPSWPQSGRIIYDDVSMRYSQDSELVLKSVSFCINGGEKVGIVGRTGAGKSSLISALFRMAPFTGRINVDDCDISTLNLPEYRRRLSVIPQDPVLLASSIRYNLDPFNQHSDVEIWNALEEVKLTEQIRNIPGGIESLVVEGGANFSAGQRQLICLARAVLQKNKIILLDEATSNVDKYCDEVMQNVIRNHFVDSTILVIAHRLDTIIDLDKVMVLSKGQVLEYQDPHLLLQNDGEFSRMVNQTGKENAQMLKDMAFASYRKRT